MPHVPPSSSPLWTPAVHAGRRPILLARGRIVASLRAWFAARDFVEVETASLRISPGNETHLHAFATSLITTDGSSAPLYLRTSPEFACKKLLAAGERRIVEFARSFRNRERGALHHPEFTLLEWYRAGEPYDVLINDCIAIVGDAARVAQTNGNSVFAVARPIPSPNPSGLRLRGLSRALPKSTFSRRYRARRRIETDLPARRRTPASESPPMIAGPIYSAVSWWSGSSPISASAAPRSLTNIPPCFRLWPDARGILAWRNASRFMSAAWSSSTALAN